MASKRGGRILLGTDFGNHLNPSELQHNRVSRYLPRAIGQIE